MYPPKSLPLLPPGSDGVHDRTSHTPDYHFVNDNSRITHGERGIRTLGAVTHTRFPVVHLRPLGHLSIMSISGERGIRTPGPVTGSRDFESRAFNQLGHLSAKALKLSKDKKIMVFLFFYF